MNTMSSVEQGRSAYFVDHLSRPWSFCGLLLGLVFITEAAIMLALDGLFPNPLSAWVGAIVDASTLSSIIAPALWLLLVKPLRSQTQRLTAVNNELQRVLAGRDRAEEQLRFQAHHDALTGLPNRASCRDHIARLFQRAQRRADASFSLLFVDLDGFKQVNDTFGHQAGDDLLTAVSGRLKRILRPGDLVARWGGDEFVVILEHTTEDGAMVVARRILHELASPFSVDYRTGEQTRQCKANISASIGISSSRRNCASFEELLTRADTAMYQVKTAGGGSVLAFQPTP